MVSRLCDDGVQGRDGRCVENSSCFQILLFVPVCILLFSWANLFPTSFHLSPSSFHLSPRLGASGRVPGWLVSHFLLFVSSSSQLWTAVSASALQSFTFVSQLWAAVSASLLQSLILHVSPSSDCCVRLCLAILYMCPRKPLHLSPSRLHICLPVSTFVSQLWTAVAASALQSFVSQLWTSQALVAECSDSKNTNCLGSTVV